MQKLILFRHLWNAVTSWLSVLLSFHWFIFARAFSQMQKYRIWMRSLYRVRDNLEIPWIWIFWKTNGSPEITVENKWLLFSLMSSSEFQYRWFSVSESINYVSLRRNKPITPIMTFSNFFSKSAFFLIIPPKWELFRLKSFHTAYYVSRTIKEGPGRNIY